MIDLTGVEHHPAVSEIVEVLNAKTQNNDRGFFQAEVAYFLGKMASNMRAVVVTKDRGEIPVNIYALALGASGYGKGYSVNIVENEFMKDFKQRFLNETFPVIAEKHLWELATDRSARNGTDPQEEFERIEKEYKSAGTFAYTFDSGSTPAVKQLRHKLLLSNSGAISLQIDEIGSNLMGSAEIMNLFLELYDQGMVKQKITKVSAENTRNEEVDGKTPTNMLLFGTPASLLDNGATEDQFYGFLETGYARRCIFGWGQLDRKAFESQSAEEVYYRLIDPANSSTIQKWAAHFEKLADPVMYGWKMGVSDEVAIALLQYKMDCERAAFDMGDHEEIKRSEISHRYFKALKLAGAYAFIDSSMEVEMEHLKQAILLVEESGKAFQAILSREKAYVKLAKYISSIGREVTHADMVEDLPFYPKAANHRNDMINLAIAWGYREHISIKKSYIDSIEFFLGERLQETDLNEIVISYGDHWAYNYLNERVPFDQLHVLTQTDGMNWANHHFKNGHRAEENTLAGFNMIVIDVDGGVSRDAVHDLLSDYKFMTYTTKRHTEEENRFRLMIPINYNLELDSNDFKEFMNSFMEWLPFKTDDSANQRSKKWECYEGGEYFYNLEGDLLDCLPFIPKTTKNDQFKQAYQQVQSLDNLERWFAQRMMHGNRNNHMLKFALALVDNGMGLVDVTQMVHSFNKKIKNPLPDSEIDNTILVTVAKRFTRN